MKQQRVRLGNPGLKEINENARAEYAMTDTYVNSTNSGQGDGKFTANDGAGVEHGMKQRLSDETNQSSHASEIRHKM